MEKIIMKKARRRVSRKPLLIFFSILAGISLYYLYPRDERAVVSSEPKDSAVNAPVPVIADREEKIEITEGSTYGSLLAQAGIDYETQIAIYDAALPFYDLATVRQGRSLNLIYDKNSFDLKKLIYRIDSEDELHAQKTCTSTPPLAAATGTPGTAGEAEPPCAWNAAIIPIAYEVKIKTAEGIVETSMYQAALDSDIDIRAIIELANAFQWTIDFAMDPRVGDAFKFVYEERYLNGQYAMPGRILAGRYINDGKPYDVYWFEEDSENTGFFDTDGNSVQKMFLKAPVAFKYISSGFTTGARYIEAFNISTGHRAIDYAAPAGTPIRAVGDGTVTSAGWSSAGYGNLTSIRHNGTYSTNYAHQSRIIVKRGQKVKQGETIGYVGSTGLSTGPHLHFEMVKNGVKINPLREILPPGQPVKDENKDRFFAAIAPYQKMLE